MNPNNSVGVSKKGPKRKKFVPDNGIGKAAGAAAKPKLNVNANEFVPRRGMAAAMPCNDEPPNSGHIERKPKEPKMMLPWKGFPKRKQQKTQSDLGASAQPIVDPINNDRKTEKPKGWMRPVGDPKPTYAVVKNPLLEQKPIKATPDNWRARDRKPVAKPHNTDHLSRESIAYKPDERVAVDRLRVRKRERIEQALKGQKMATDQKMSKEMQKLKLEEKQVPKPPIEGALPKRYIPTNKQWDERCKAKALEAEARANKENSMAGIAKGEQEADNPEMMASSNAMPPNKTEKRRGNLIHSRSIWRVFSNCGLLPTPNTGPKQVPEMHFELPPKDNVRRYNIEELLQLEPEADQLPKPIITEAYRKFSLLSE